MKILQNFVGETSPKYSFGRLGRRWEDNMKLDLGEAGSVNRRRM
jgi:hypothetical protein